MSVQAPCDAAAGLPARLGQSSERGRGPASSPTGGQDGADRRAAEALAARTDWPALYDLDRLAVNEVPVVAAVYHDDMYVDREHALAAAGAVRGLRTWVTDAYAHDGVRADAAVLDRLIAMSRGEA
jgi:hypothetical protein